MKKLLALIPTNGKSKEEISSETRARMQENGIFQEPVPPLLDRNKVYSSDQIHQFLDDPKISEDFMAQTENEPGWVLHKGNLSWVDPSTEEHKRISAEYKRYEELT